MANAHGDGSLRKRSDGRWEGRYVDPTGKQRSVYGKTKPACKEKLRRAQAEILTGTYMEPAQITMEEWMGLWLSEQEGRIRTTTWRHYEGMIRLYLTPHIGRHRLDKLTPLHIQALFRTLGDQLAPTSVVTVRRLLATILNAAVRLDLLRSNPLHKLLPPRRPPEEPLTLVDRKDIPAFVAAARETKYATAALLLLQTGIRSGELRGLRWSDVDLDAGTMTIRQQITWDGGVTVQPPKSGKVRRIVMMEETVALLRRHKSEQAAARLAAGGWKDDDLTRDLVFRRKDGRALSIGALRAPVMRIGAAIGIPELRPHDLRHSYAVAALRSGIDVKTVQNNLGHARAAMTLDVYAGYTDDMGREAARKLSAYWTKNLGSI